MSIISIGDLSLGGSNLFADAESFFGSMQDLSENELKMTFGGKKSKKGKRSSSKSSSSRSSSDRCCYCGHDDGGDGGNGGGGSN